MPFAGHPTLGTAHVVRALTNAGDRVTLEMIAGVIPVDARGDTWTLQANRAEDARRRGHPAELAAMLALAEADVAPDPAAPPLWVDTGSEQLMIPLASADAVRRAAPRTDLLLAHGHTGQRAMAYVFAPAPGGSPASGDRGWSCGSSFRSTARSSKTRGLAPHVPTSAAGCSRPARPCRNGYAVAQGDAVGRPCRLGLEVTADRRIQVSGRVVELARGTVTL